MGRKDKMLWQQSLMAYSLPVSRTNVLNLTLENKFYAQN